MSSDRPPSSGDRMVEPPDTEQLDAPTLDGLPTNADAEQATLPPEPTGGNKNVGQQSQSSSPAVGTQFGDYEILSEIARGGMGVIYKARQKSLNRTVALKMILSGQFASEDEIRRFNAESTAAAQLDHPHIVPIYDSGVHGESHYFSMKLIEGQDLGREMPRLRSDLKAGVALLEKICRAIHHAHQRGILHRDLKPANILLDADNEPYLTDLGLARHVESDNQLTQTGAVVGTPSYMPPEQASGSSDITTAVDIYSLGAILYELLAGKPPFQSDNVMATLMQVINESPERPSVSVMTDRNLEMVAMKCLSKSPTERYPTAEALADDLLRWLNGEPVSVRAPSFAVVARNWLRQNFGHAIWILIIGLVSGIVAGMGLWMATIQQEMSEIRSIYDEMPSVDAPFTVASWNTPSWLVIPSMFAFTGAVMFIGYLTAALARTKNRSADLAAGIVVGVISAGAAFFICFGTLSILAMGFGNDDIELVSKASAIPNGETSADLRALLDDYPELEPLPRADQIQMILRKIESDTLYQARNGIAMGTISSLILFLTAGIVETLLAGPIIRSSPNLGAALAQYVFRSYPFVVATVIFGVHATGVAVLGHHGIVWSWLSITTIVVLLIGMFAELRRWHWGIRLPLVISIGMLFWCFFAYSFTMMPMVAQSTVEANKRIRLAELYPDNLRLKDRAVYAMLYAGVKLYNGRYYKQADQRFVQAIEYLNDIPPEKWTEELTDNWRTGIVNRAKTLQALDQIDEAVELLDAAIDHRPSNTSLRADGIRFLHQNDRRQKSKEWFEAWKVTTIDDWNEMRDVAGVCFEADEPKVLYQHLAAALDRSPLEDSIRDQARQSLLKTQHWRIVGPVAFDDRDEIETRLVAFSPSQTGADFPGVDSVTVSTFDFQGVRLDELLGDSNDDVSCYALAVVTLDQAEDVWLYLGSDDSASIWINGQQIQESSGEGRAFWPREDQLQHSLRAGDNVILLRIDQNGGRWQFALEIASENGWPLGVAWADLSETE
ncbi:MAG: serine/threonine-protein kinase [Planctomycetota bacterium]